MKHLAEFQTWLSGSQWRQVILSLLAFGVIFAVRLLVHRAIRRGPNGEELKRRWMIQVRNATALALLLVLVLIWAAELRGFALSVVAIAAAVVIATKELIMCLSGTVLRSGKLDIGDRVEINNIRGDVIDHTLLTTTLLEVGPGEMTQQHTGRAVVLPNSMFLTMPLTNESFTEDFVLHVMKIPLEAAADWRAAERVLLSSARRACEEYLDEAKRHMEEHGRKHGLYTLGVDPRVTLQVMEPGRIDLVLRFPAPVRRKGRIAQLILRDFAKHLSTTTSVGGSAAPGSGE